MTSPVSTLKVDLLFQQGLAILTPVFGKEAAYETRRILADYLSIPISTIRLDADRISITSLQQDDINKCFKRRAKREPAQYIAGHTWFMGEEFKVGEGVLIPRNDTEVLVEEALRITLDVFKEIRNGQTEDCCETKTAQPVFEFLELCTGSGCIALSLILKLQNAGINASAVATDISLKAMEYASENSQNLGCSEKIRLLQHDILHDLPELLVLSDRMYPMLLANPPYIKSEIVAGLEPEVRDYEPWLSLDGGTDGLEFYRRILECSRDLLSPGGWILLEIGYDQGAAITKMMEDTEILENIAIRRDYGGNPRVAIAKMRHWRK